jgi:hypothetical protein
MRKALGLLFATSLLIPIGVVAAGPAGSAVKKGPTCKTLTATGLFKPALPKISALPNPPKVTSHVSSKGKIGGCTGVKGVTSATTTDKYTYVGNCNTFSGISAGGVTKPGPASIKWNKGPASTVTITTKVLSKPGVQPAIIQLTTKITKGQFAGTKSVSKVKGTAATGACITAPLGAFKLTGTGASGFK